MTADYYHLLSISPDANEREIKVAYRRMAEVYHPDKLRELPPVVRKEGEEIMRLLNEAKSVLLDPSRRADYDRTRGALGRPPSEAIILGEEVQESDFTDFVIEEGAPDLDGKMRRVLSSMREVFVRDKTFQKKIAYAEEIVEAQVVGEEEPSSSEAGKGPDQEMTLEFSVVSKKPMRKQRDGKRTKFRVIAVEEEGSEKDAEANRGE